MKKRLTTIGIALCFLGYSAHAQSDIIKTHAGVTFSSVNVKGIPDQFTPSTSLQAGFRAGVSVDLPLDDSWSFSTGFDYAEKGFQAHEGLDVEIFNLTVPIGVTAMTKIRYLEVPMLFKYQANKGNIKPYFFAGPALGYAIDGQIKTRASVLLDLNLGTIGLNMSDDLYNRWEVSGLAGAGLSIPAGTGNIELSAAYQHSLTDILANPIIDVRLRNYGIQFGIGYKMKF